MAMTTFGPSLTVSSMEGLGERCGRELSTETRRSVEELFVDEDEGEMTDKSEVVEALERERSLAVLMARRACIGVAWREGYNKNKQRRCSVSPSCVEH